MKKHTYKRYKKNNIVFIYQMGKVASRTILESVKASGYDAFTAHTINGHINEQIFSGYKNPANLRLSERKNVFLSTLKRKIILLILKSRQNLKVITIIREPVSRNESFYFQDLHIPLCQLSKHDWTWVYKKNNTQALIEEYLKNLNRFHGINWFDNELKKRLGIDVYSHPFDKDKGYRVIKHKNIDLLIIKLEKLNEVKSDVFNDFLGVDNFSLKNKNVGQEKWYSPLYKEFKDTIVYPKEYLDSLYQSKYMKHFYSEEEIDSFYSRLKIQD